MSATPSDDERFARLFHRDEAEDRTTALVRCQRCGYVTSAAPLDPIELGHYVRTGESRVGGCPLHPWGWHYWNTDAKPPPDYSGQAARLDRKRAEHLGSAP